MPRVFLIILLLCSGVAMSESLQVLIPGSSPFTDTAKTVFYRAYQQAGLTQEVNFIASDTEQPSAAAHISVQTQSVDQAPDLHTRVPTIQVLVLSTNTGTSFQSWNDLATENLVVVRTNKLIRNKARDYEPIIAEDFFQALQMLEVGRASALVITNLELQIWPQKVEPLTLSISVIDSYQLVHSLASDYSQLQQPINSAIEAMRSSGELNLIMWQSLNR